MRGEGSDGSLEISQLSTWVIIPLTPAFGGQTSGLSDVENASRSFGSVRKFTRCISARDFFMRPGVSFQRVAATPRNVEPAWSSLRIGPS